MDSKAAAADLHERLRFLGERVQSAQPLTICIFLDGENAWEYYPGNGREFLREFYGRISSDQDFRALTARKPLRRQETLPVTPGIFPASWINANFDVWIGHAGGCDGVGVVVGCAGRVCQGGAIPEGRDMPTLRQNTALKASFESILAAEGSDWCWWFGPEHSTENDAEFDALFRKHLTGVYLALGRVPPEELASPIKRKPEHALQLPPTGFIK